MMNIIFFPFAGGHKFSYQNLIENIENKDKIKVIEYPGRGTRMKEEFAGTFEELIEDCMRQIGSMLDNNEKYILYGHSMGGLLAYEISMKIQEMHHKMPEKLVITGRTPPSRVRTVKYTHQSDDMFWKEVCNLGGIPKDFRDNEDFKSFVIPILRADFSIYESYTYQENKGKLKIPIDVFYGSEEHTDGDLIMEGWKRESEAPVQISELEGDHFFIFNNLDFFQKYFRNF
ncbi:thioesterase II family protein [Flavobacterium pectinovorum]|uniref:Surfactin synthase thioesterase subunit n=2 Tax=Flavobacterium pectinovorum TaxID=29533 RepID=A0ABY1J8X4_9FLAO|nr:thioesterase domain-containing protein [Flavobacterium pectinovorum]SHN14715.1 Surfactin synthase thioesterase subunit [Flavobacterium pectinovorum]